MATFKEEIFYRRSDGTYNVRIRVTHNRVTRRISTHLYVTDADLTRSLKLKNAQTIKSVNALLDSCREACNDMGFALFNMSADELVEKLKAHLAGGDRFRLDFMAYMTKKAAEMKKGTGGSYLNTVNALKRYTKSDSLDISEISIKFLSDFESFLENEPSQRGNNRKTPRKDLPKKGGRAVSKYLGCIRAIHNEAKKEFNDEDRGVICIPYSPFKHFKIKPQPKTRKRALSVVQIQEIIDIPYTDLPLFNLAKDCFILSFALIGINSVDMYYAEHLKGDVLTYHRSKTKDRRDDSAEMRVKVEPVLSRLLDKYKDDTRLFNFHKRYSTPATFNRALNKGLKLLGERIGVADLEFYAARHSWATIARSSIVGVDKATVHEALNHVDASMKVTDIYIKKDWLLIENANKIVMSVFNWALIFEEDLR